MRFWCRKPILWMELPDHFLEPDLLPILDVTSQENQRQKNMPSAKKISLSSAFSTCLPSEGIERTSARQCSEMDKKYLWKNRLIWAGLVYHSSFHCASDVLERSTHHSTNHCKQKYDDDVSQVKLRAGPSSNQPSSRQVASRTRHPGQIGRADGEKQHLAPCW